MPLPPVRAFCRTLRSRLAAWNTAGVLLLVGLSLTGIHAGLRLTLFRMVDEFLGEELLSASLDVTQLAPDWSLLEERLNARAAGHPRRRLFVEVLDAEGQRIWASVHTPTAGLPPVAGAPANRPVPFGSYHLIQQPVLAPDGARLVVRVGCSVERANSDLARFTYIMLAVGGGLLLLAPLGGYLLAGRATRPLANIIATTARLQPDHLKERLPIRATRDELDQLSLTINGLFDRIAHYLTHIREFTANAAHELRSPLTALYSSLEVALNADRSPDEYREILADLLEECGRLRALLNQLLLLAEGDAGRLCARRDPVRLDRVAVRSLEMFQAVAELADVGLKAPVMEPVIVRGDETCLWQVVNNLLDNAIKFTPAGGSVSVELRAEGASGGCLLRVTDTGPGVPAEDLPHVFERFFRADKSRHRDGRSQGAGLGLSICQSVVVAHNGTIQVASTAGAGTEVTIRLPACTAVQAAGEALSASKA